MKMKTRAARRLALVSAMIGVATAGAAGTAQAATFDLGPLGQIDTGQTATGAYITYGYVGAGCGAHCGHTVFVAASASPSPNPATSSTADLNGTWYDGSVHLWNVHVTGPSLSSPVPSVTGGAI